MYGRSPAGGEGVFDEAEWLDRPQQTVRTIGSEQEATRAAISPFILPRECVTYCRDRACETRWPTSLNKAVVCVFPYGNLA